MAVFCSTRVGAYCGISRCAYIIRIATIQILPGTPGYPDTPGYRYPGYQFPDTRCHGSRVSSTRKQYRVPFSRPRIPTILGNWYTRYRVSPYKSTARIAAWPRVELIVGCKTAVYADTAATFWRLSAAPKCLGGGWLQLRREANT
eukprot:1692890-Rhodomonas_salina.1